MSGKSSEKLWSQLKNRELAFCSKHKKQYFAWLHAHILTYMHSHACSCLEAADDSWIRLLAHFGSATAFLHSWLSITRRSCQVLEHITNARNRWWSRASDMTEATYTNKQEPFDTTTTQHPFHHTDKGRQRQRGAVSSSISLRTLCSRQQAAWSDMQSIALMRVISWRNSIWKFSAKLNKN